MMAGNPNWWNMYVQPPSCHQLPPPPPPSTLLTSSSSSSSTSPYFFHPQFVVGSSSPAQPPHDFRPFSNNSVVNDQEQLPHSWCQLLPGGLPVEEEGHFQTRKLGNWESEHDKISDGTLRGADTKQEAVSPSSNNSSNDAYAEELLLPLIMPTPWMHIKMPVSSPTSCVSSLSGGGNVWDFSKTTKESGKNRISHHSSECNSTATGGACKKARVHPPSSEPPLKVRKEKLGDRVTALHQLVSPFGKTDTASVLLEAIGYIRFLQGQIEALSSPYLGNNNGSANNVESHHHSVQGEASYAFLRDSVAQVNHHKPKDLRSRGLCLVPVSSTSQVGNENGADYWAPAFGGGF